ncbi:MAG: GNAT family N-acetyltransferase [Desulfocapsaceae bacterium]|nr:GNAT family N-acetyltransferase [Desulfocapsaceae bacterium]
MIRSATERDASTLTNISHASKRYWNYPQEYIAIWKDELTITPQYINDHQVFVYEHDAAILAYYSLVELKADITVVGARLKMGFWLDHMFVDPISIGKGIGRLLFTHLLNHCQVHKISKVRILADPHSRGFYDKMGCIYKGEQPSTIANRTTPLYTLDINGKAGVDIGPNP